MNTNTTIQNLTDDELNTIEGGMPKAVKAILEGLATVIAGLVAEYIVDDWNEGNTCE